jgi:hypothetical protein
MLPWLPAVPDRPIRYVGPGLHDRAEAASLGLVLALCNQHLPGLSVLPGGAAGGGKLLVRLRRVGPGFVA